MGKMLVAQVHDAGRIYYAACGMGPALWKSRRYSVYKTLVYLLQQEFKQIAKGKPIPVSTKALMERGVSRSGKWRDLRELETLGICAIEHRPNRSPLARLSEIR
jgi:hypothetical protein